MWQKGEMTLCRQLTDESSSFQRVTSRARTVNAMLVSVSNSLYGLYNDTTALEGGCTTPCRSWYAFVRTIRNKAVILERSDFSMCWGT